MSGLARSMDGGVDPGHVEAILREHFDAVETVEASREGWYDMICIQFRTEEQDARIRLRVRFIWSPSVGGWTYRILPGDRA